MASYRAAATGNWSALATWSVWSGTAWVAATSVPGSADDVWANGQTVTINQNVTVLTIRNATTGAPGTGTVAGGGFSIPTGGFTLTCTNTIINTMVATAVLLTISHATGTTTLNLSIIFSTGVNIGTVNITNTSIINWNGSLAGISNTNNISMVVVTAAANINIVGSVYANGGTASTNNNTLFFTTGSGGFVLSVTGDVYFNNALQGAGTCSAIFAATAGTINITGNVYSGTGVNTNATIPLIITGNCIVTIVGNVTGGQVFASQQAISCSGLTASISITGNVVGGNAGNNGSGAIAISNTGAQSITRLNGLIISGNYGCFPLYCARLFLANNTSKYTEYASNSTNGALFPSAAPTRETMYSPNTLADAPAPANVRFGVVYASGSQTGTLIVPSPSNVALGIPTDNTVGTAVLTQANVKQAVWDALLTDLTTPDSIGVRLKNAATVDSTGDQIANLVNT